MDIVIAAAGKGTRLKGVGGEIPKHIIPVAGRPFLYYLLDAVVASGFRRIFIVGGHHVNKLEEAVAAYPHDGSIKVVNQTEQLGADVYGTACPVQAVEQLVQGDRFVYTMGDHLLSEADLQSMQQSTRDNLLAVTEHDEPERYGVVEMNDDYTVKRIVEKPSRPTSRYINVGLYTFTPEIFPIVRTLQPSERGELEITDAINTLAKQQAFRIVQLQRPWLDLGRPEDIASLEQFLRP